MIVKSSRIRFLEAWARDLPTRDPEEIKHAVEVFAQARFGVSEKTARRYAVKVLEALGRLGLTEGEVSLNGGGRIVEEKEE